jgi:hypothetical protein
MRSVVLLLLIGLPMLLVAPGPFEPVAVRTAAAEQPLDSGLMAAKPPPVRRYPFGGGVIGWVTAVDARSITIWERGPGAKPVKYPACEELARGELVPAYADDDPTYPLADVRVGDLVLVYLSIKEVYEIRIWRRPGGRLGPPSVAGRGPRFRYNVHLGLFAGEHPYHEWINAFQDFEERGIPLPPKMRPQHGPRAVRGGGILQEDGTITLPPPPPPRFWPLWSDIEPHLPGRMWIVQQRVRLFILALHETKPGSPPGQAQHVRPRLAPPPSVR